MLVAIRSLEAQGLCHQVRLQAFLIEGSLHQADGLQSLIRPKVTVQANDIRTFI